MRSTVFVLVLSLCLGLLCACTEPATPTEAPAVTTEEDMPMVSYRFFTRK